MSGMMRGQPPPQSMWPTESLGILDDDDDSTYQPMPALSSYTIAYWNEHANLSSPSMPPSSKSRLAAHLSRAHTPCDTSANSSGSGIEHGDSHSHHLSSPLILHPTSRNTSHSLQVSDDDPSNAEFPSDIEKCTPATTPGFSLSHKHDLSILLTGQAAIPTKRSRLSRHFRRSQGSIGCPKRALEILEESKNASHSVDKSFDNDEKILQSKYITDKASFAGMGLPLQESREVSEPTRHSRKSSSPQASSFYATTKPHVLSTSTGSRSKSRSPESALRPQSSFPSKSLNARSHISSQSADAPSQISSHTSIDRSQMPYNSSEIESHLGPGVARAPSPALDSAPRSLTQSTNLHVPNSLMNPTSGGRYLATTLTSSTAPPISKYLPTEIGPSKSVPRASENDVPSDTFGVNSIRPNPENAVLGQENALRNSKTISRPQVDRVPLQTVLSHANQPNGHFLKPKAPKPINLSSHTLEQPPKTIVTNPPATATVHDSPIPLPVLPPPRSSLESKHRITINAKHYEKLELLGRGGSAKVYKVKTCDSNKLYAVKKVTFDQFEESCAAGFKGEIDLLLKLAHAERVVKLVDHEIFESGIFLVMECGDVDLAHVLQQKLGTGAVLDPEFVRYHAIEMFKCVEQVHDAGIVHSDLKPANFLFVRGMLKLIDFGIANAVPEHTANVYRDSQIGTPNYMAPEALIEVSLLLHGYTHTMPKTVESQYSTTWKVGKPLDVWSCGCIIYQMIYGRPPYGGYTGNLRIQAIMNPQVRISYPREGLGGKLVPESAIELMQRCLTRNPAERSTVSQCMRCDFLNPKIVSRDLVRDVVHLAVNFGFNNHANGGPPLTSSVYDAMIDTVMTRIRDLNYA